MRGNLTIQAMSGEEGGR